MAKEYRVTAVIRIANAVNSWLARIGIGRTVVLTTIGRRSRKARSVPVLPIHLDGIEYVVAPYGQMAWVRNARADYRVWITRGNSVRETTLQEETGEQAAAVALAYHQREARARRYMDVPRNPTIEDFVAAAEQFPVFKVA